MLGFGLPGSGLPGFGLPIDNGADGTDIDKSNGNSTAGGNARRTVVGGFCKNCNVVCYILFDSPLGRMCKSCHAHWRRTGNRRPISGPESFQLNKRSTHNSAAAAAADRSKRKPPRGMYINHDDLTSLAGCKSPCEYLAEGDRKIAALLAEIQKNRQMMEQLEKDCSGQVQEESAPKATAPTEGAAAATAAGTAAGTGTGAAAVAGTGAGVASAPPAQPRTTARWAADEIQVALLALRDYGKNFPMIAKVVGTKTEAHVRTFYVSNRRRFNLDQIVKEYEATIKADEEENNDAAAATAAAAAVAGSTGNNVGEATAGSGPGSGSVKASVSSDASEVVNSQELLAKKDGETANTTTNTITTKKKPELMNATVAAPIALSGTGTGTGATTTGAGSAAASASTAAAGNGAAGNNNNKSMAPTITIVDESDTATSSSSDVTNTNSNITALTTATTTTSAIGNNSVSSLSSGLSNSSSNNNNNSSQIAKSSTTATSTSTSSSSSTTTSTTNNNHNEAESVESTSLKSTNHAVAKRENSDLNTAELPPAKKLALTVNAEFLAK